MPAQANGDYTEKRNKFFAAEIHRFVREFQNIEISVSPKNMGKRTYVFVHPPYMCQSVSLIDNNEQFKQLKERHRVRLLRVKEARETADVSLKTFMDRQFYEEDGREKLIASGRGKRSEIKALLQAAVNEGVISISQDKGYPNTGDLRRWLKRYGVGIDCSGFVQQVLQHLVKVNRDEVEEIQDKASELDDYFLRCRWVYENIKGGERSGQRLFLEVQSPAHARPGDVVVSQSHMRIVANVEVVEDGEIVFELAESTSARDLPSGYSCEEADIGPRILLVKYTKPNQPILRQTPQKRRLIDASFTKDSTECLFIIGRWHQFE